MVKTKKKSEARLKRIKESGFVIEKGPSYEQLSLINNMLFDAVRESDLNKAMQALHAGADVNSVNQYKETPLMIAASCGNISTVKLLCESHAEVNARDQHGNTALLDAVYWGYAEIIRVLLSYNARFDVVGCMYDDKKLTPLMMAVDRDYEEVVKMLIAAGAPVSFTNNQGESALSMATPKMHAIIASAQQEYKKSGKRSRGNNSGRKR